MDLFAVNWDWLYEPRFWIGVGVIAGTYALVALGLQLNVGFTGIVNFGQAGFMAVGAYAMALLIIDTEISFWLAMPIAMLISMGFALLVGLPSLRLRADYFAIATIALAEMVRLIAQNSRDFTGGNQGLFCDEKDFTQCYDTTWLDFSEKVNGWFADVGWSDTEVLFPLLLAVWILVGVLTLVLSRVQKTPWGRVLRAIREDEDAARALGKNAFVYKLQSLVIASAIAAMAGFVLALNLATIHPVDFEPIVTFLAYGVLILGGLANYWGVAFGSLILWTVIEGTREADILPSASDDAGLRFIITGLILILLMAFRPQGVFGKKEEMVLGE